MLTIFFHLKNDEKLIKSLVVIKQYFVLRNYAQCIELISVGIA